MKRVSGSLSCKPVKYEPEPSSGRVPASPQREKVTLPEAEMRDRESGTLILVMVVPEAQLTLTFPSLQLAERTDFPLFAVRERRKTFLLPSYVLSQGPVNDTGKQQMSRRKGLFPTHMGTVKGNSWPQMVSVKELYT